MKNARKRFLLSSLVLMMILSFCPLLGGAGYCRCIASNNLVNHPIISFQPAQATQSPQGYNVTQIRNAYNLPSNGGSGTIAIIDAYDDPTVNADLNVFSSYYNLPPVNDTNFTKHKMAPSIPVDYGWAGEISGDVQWAHAIAPNAKILLVEATNDLTISPLLSAVDYARNQTINPDVVGISMSWGFSEYSGEINDDFHFNSSKAVFFACSMDYGYGYNVYPAASPNVIAVGGTSLTFNADGSVASETGWSRSGGFRSFYEKCPIYQQAYGGNETELVYAYRAVPDVSFFADSNPGVPIYTSYDPSNVGWNTFSGTSLGTPCWAAIHSLGLSCSNDRFYKIASGRLYPSDFRDITSGNNGVNAGPGYDYVTGLGSPLTTAFNYLSNASACDINDDGEVNILDAVLMANAFRSQPGDLNWNTLADVNNDYKVDILDEIIFGLYFGTSGTSGQSSTSSSAGTMTQSGPTVLVDPSQTTVFKGDVFTVNVNVTNITDLQGWEFKLYWNNTALNCTNAVVVTPTIWQGNTQDDGPGLQANYNSTNRRFWQAEAANYPAPPFNGSMTITTLTFQALQPGTTSLTLADTTLGNSTAQPIACSVSSGSVTVYYGRYMRGDTQTINGLNAYVLSIPESTSSASVTQSGLEAAPSWGIRVFVRHSDGTETEVVLDGQAGTPKAVVGGSGLQSANTSVSQTTLQSTDSLVVRVYVWLGVDNGWSPYATFTTEQLQASTLQAATWTVFYNVRTTFNRLSGYTGTFYWGNTYNSRVQNLQYA